MKDFNKMVREQREFFNTGTTRKIAFRKEQLNKLKMVIKHHEDEIILALKKDLNKSEFEAYATELGMVYEEINFMLKHIDNLSKPKRVKTPIMHFPSKSYIYKEPYGIVLVMSPWNYPFQLAITPLVGAIATGNCAVIKPANYSSAVAAIISKLLSNFPEKYIAVVEGDRYVNNALLEEKFDYIFFTGSPQVGRLVMEKASKHLTPVTLELGGKSPCIIDETADIPLSVKRIVWGKLLNAGQTCVAPDYLLVHEKVKEELIKNLKKYIIEFYGNKPELNPDYPKIITQRHFDRLRELIQQENDKWGGSVNAHTLQIAPTLFLNTDWDSLIMEDEIFGPIFPIIAYNNIEEAMDQINLRSKPLALYLFTTSKEQEEKIIGNISFGGGCINDTIIHLANANLPFGGVGESGMGSYHGRQSFATLSHGKSILKKGLWLDINIRYAPYGKKLSLLKKFM